MSDVVKEFHEAQKAYNAEDAKSVDRYLSAKDAALAAGFHVSSANPQNAVISHTAKVKDPAPVIPGVKVTDPAPQPNSETKNRK